MSYTAQTLEFNNDFRIVLQEKPLATIKETVLGYDFHFSNNDIPEKRFVDLKTLLDYTNEIMNGGTYATCQTKIEECLERLYHSAKDKAPVDYFFFRFADDILEDYWDKIEKELIGSEKVISY